MSILEYEKNVNEDHNGDRKTDNEEKDDFKAIRNE